MTADKSVANEPLGLKLKFNSSIFVKLGITLSLTVFAKFAFYYSFCDFKAEVYC